MKVLDGGKRAAEDALCCPYDSLEPGLRAGRGRVIPDRVRGCKHTLNDSPVELPHDGGLNFSPLSCQRKNRRCWPFFTNGVMLLSHFSVLVMVVPRNLKCPTTVTVVSC